MDHLVFFGLNIYAWITIATVLGVFLPLLFTKVKPQIAFFMAIAIFHITGVLTIEEAFMGFDASSVITVGLLFIVIAGLRHTNALEWMVKHLMGQPRTHARAIFRLMLPVGLLSSFMSNTATTALFQDVVKLWSGKLNMKPSKLLIPLAYAASIGGLLTLIGTPPNLIISGLYAKSSGNTINLLATLPIGAVCLIVSTLVVVALRNFLPDREPLEDKNVVSHSLDVKPTKKTYLSLTIMALLLVVSATGLVSLTVCCLVAGILMVVTRCCTSQQAEKEVDWSILLVFAGSVSIGTAVHKVGLDDLIVNNILHTCGTNPYVVLTIVCLVAATMTELLSDTACGAMFFPIAWQAAESLHVNPMPFMIALMICVSNSYATPIATPPNTMVYATGGYRFADFARLGLVLKVVNLAIAIILSTLIYPF